MTKVGLITGSGINWDIELKGFKEEVIETSYGAAIIRNGAIGDTEVALMPRHGLGKNVPPHMVNYRANIAAMAMNGVKRIFATSAVGSINPRFQPGSFVALTDFLDFTKSRISTFSDTRTGLIHVDFTRPYCDSLNQIMVESGSNLGIKVSIPATYVSVEGPRYESPAEIKMFRQLHGDVVGMTSIPEAVLAREAGICYASLGIITNAAAGIGKNPLSHQEVLEVMSDMEPKVHAIIMRAIGLLPDVMECNCRNQGSQLAF